MCYDSYDPTETALFREHSLSALSTLLAQGRELECEINGLSCFLSIHETKKAVSLWIGKQEYPFDSIEKLLSCAKIENTFFSELFLHCRIITLF